MTERDKIMRKLFDLAMSGSVSAAKLFLSNTITADDQHLTVGQTMALIRDHLKNFQKISPYKPGS